jgi:hypothetical protein
MYSKGQEHAIHAQNKEYNTFVNSGTLGYGNLERARGKDLLILQEARRYPSEGI